MKINNPFLTTKQNKGLFILEQKVITWRQVEQVCDSRRLHHLKRVVLWTAILFGTE